MRRVAMVAAFAVLASLGPLAVIPSAYAAPGNDNFAAAQTISGVTGSLPGGTNVGACWPPWPK